MTRRPISQKELAEIWTSRHKYGGMAIFQTKGLTEEEENRDMKEMFQTVWNAGYEYVHTLKVIPEHGRKPYYVHVDDVNMK